MPTPGISQEIAITLLEDLKRAIEGVMANALPGLPVDVKLVTQPKLGVLVALRESEPVYPTIHTVRPAYLRPSNYFRRLNGLPVEE